MWKSELNLDTLNHNYVRSFQLVYIWGKQESANSDSNLKIRWKLHQLVQEEEIKILSQGTGKKSSATHVALNICWRYN